MLPISEKHLARVHPELAARIRLVIAAMAAAGLQVEMVQGLRTIAEQDHLFAQGRSRPGIIVTNARGGQSNHNYGLAGDLCAYAHGAPNWLAPNSVWSMIGAEAEKVGLGWGGSWVKFIDRPHVELPGLTVKRCADLLHSGGLDAVWREASKLLGSRGQKLLATATATTTATHMAQETPASSPAAQTQAGAAASPPAITGSQPGETWHTVAPGDSFYKIAGKYGVDANELAALNHRSLDAVIMPGLELLIPDKK
jgi:peptidoglycan L-alanyl-D-glutamate endopeptidase CwlK